MSPPLRPKGEPAPAKARAVAPQVTLDVSLLGRDYRSPAPSPSERSSTRRSPCSTAGCARSASPARSAAVERIAVMAALNLAHELMRRASPAALQRPRDAGGDSNVVRFAIDDDACAA